MWHLDPGAPRKYFDRLREFQNIYVYTQPITLTSPTMAKASKQFKKFASSGKLKDTIKSRRKHQQSKRKAEERIAQRQKQRGAPKTEHGHQGGDGGEEDEDDERDVRGVNGESGGRAGGVARTVEELFGQGGLDEDEEQGSDLEELTEEAEDENEEEGEGEVDEGLLDEQAMKKAMKNLEKTDPEFFKYLRENDRELLDFGGEATAGKVEGKEKTVDEYEEMGSEENGEEEEDLDEEEDDDEDRAPRKTSVTMRMLREWQQGMIKVSLHHPSMIDGEMVIDVGC